MPKEVVWLKSGDRLDKYTKSKLEKNEKETEKLSEKDIKNLMGMNRDRYERRGGAIRRK
ncbi:hypothetical protein [Alkalihalobacterium alkalinitrilicum]|uniref:hypothetical protein n=1 Tax=Alkalihalobacterium alkalinitrilicum TaxID=427920 RepID=UPI001473AEF1|nr:hypothetical protein [Alkalihalobacterium alkalinitrilicum]